MSTQVQPSLATPAVSELVPLFEEALRTDNSTRALKAGYLNAVIGRLARTEDPAALAPVLQALLAMEGVTRLVDEQGTPVSIAATQALVSLAYPHPLEVPPEHLEALRRQREPAMTVPPAPKGWMFTVLVLATGVQAVCFILADDMRHMFHGLSADQLASATPLQPPPSNAFIPPVVKEVWRGVRPMVPWVQFVGSAVLYYFATSLATTASDRFVVRRAFLGLGVMGLVLGVLPMHVYENYGTLAAGVGAVLTGWMLRLPKPAA